MFASLFALSLAVAPAFADPVPGDCLIAELQIELAAERVEMMSDRYESILHESEREDNLRAAAKQHVRIVRRMQAHADELREQMGEVVAPIEAVAELVALEQLIVEQVALAEEIIQLIQISPGQISHAERSLAEAERALAVLIQTVGTCAD
jgi:hypothetical protein